MTVRSPATTGLLTLLTPLNRSLNRLRLRYPLNRIATEFLTRCFYPGETIAVLLRNRKTLKTQQRIVTIETAISPNYMSWLTYENRQGANIYISANPLLAGSRKRTKDSVASVRHLYIDLDIDGATSLAALRASELTPKPTAIIRTSADKYQVIWKVEGFDFSMQEMTLKLLATSFHGDPACTDCNRVLRMPGFLNCKYEPAWPVGAHYTSDSVYAPTDFRLIDGREQATKPVPFSHKAHPAIPTNSEHDWAWVSQRLAQGKEATQLTIELAELRSDKPNPLYYAQRTVDMASARLSLLEGIAINEVIGMLVTRRRLEIPAAICLTRAREIAVTAQRMIARNRIA